MKNILFPTAYSQSSKNTWRYALRLAQHFNAKITLMHVYEMKSTLSIGEDLFDEDFSDQLDMLSEERFLSEQQRLHQFASDHTPKQFHKVTFDFVIAAGNVTAAIIEEMNQSPYDLLILGTKRQQSFTEKIFGSTARKILKLSPAPVLLVPPMSYYLGINKIVYTTNFQAGDLKAIHHLMEWVQIFDAKLHLLHVISKTLGSKTATEKMTTLMRTFQEENEAGTLTFQLLEGPVVRRVDEYLEMIHGDMVAMTTHNRGFFSRIFEPSVTDQIANDSIVPILIFKE